MPEDTSTFTTSPKRITDTGEFAWGGESGWEDIDQSSGVSVTNGTVRPATIPTTGLLLHYNFEQETGQLIDQTGNGHDSSSVSVTSRSATGITGNAYDFNGETDGVTTPLSIETNAITIAAWTRLNVSGGEQDNYAKLVALSDGEDNRAWLQVSKHSGFGFGLRDSTDTSIGSIRSQTEAEALTWAFVVGTYDGSTVTFYINGTRIGSQDTSGPLSSLDGLQIGKQVLDTQYLDGRMDQVFVYVRGLSKVEVNQVYDATRKP